MSRPTASFKYRENREYCDWPIFFGNKREEFEDEFYNVYCHNDGIRKRDITSFLTSNNFVPKSITVMPDKEIVEIWEIN